MNTSYVLIIISLLISISVYKENIIKKTIELILKSFFIWVIFIALTKEINLHNFIISLGLTNLFSLLFFFIKTEKE